MTSDSDITRIAVIGYGAIGKRHIQNLSTLRPTAAVCVARFSGTDQPVPDSGIRTVFSLQELTAFQPQAAIIASPAPCHISVADALLQTGCHVLIEKPLAHCVSATATLTGTLHNQQTVAVGYSLRHLALMREVKRLVDSGELGRIFSVRASVGQYLPDWRPQQDYRKVVSARKELGGGALLELSHEVDYLQWIFGVPNTVVAMGGRSGLLELDVEDHVDLLWKYDDRHPSVSVHLDMLDRAGCRTLYIAGETGVLSANLIDRTARHYRAESGEWQVLSFPEDEDRNGMYMKELVDFFACIESGQSPVCTLSEGIQTLAIVDAAKASLELGGKATKVEAA